MEGPHPTASIARPRYCFKESPHPTASAPSLSRPRSLRPRLADLAHAVPWKVPIPQRRLRVRVTASRKVPIPQRRLRAQDERRSARAVICPCGGDGRDLRVRRRGHSSPIAEGAKVPERDISAPSPIAEGARGSAPTRTRFQRHPPHAKSPPSALLHPLPFLH
jgi:hypothetical protein